MKIDKTITLLLLFLVNCWPSVYAQSYFSYRLPSEGARLGDKLILYVNAKWLSYRHGLPLLYKPFEYSDKFMFSKLEMPYEQAKFNETTLITWDKKPDYKNLNNVVFEVGNDPLCEYILSEINFKDSQFRAELKKNLAPTIELETVKPPKECISIAVHVRKNSNGYDFPLSYEVIEKLGYLPEGTYTDLMFPLKHPSDDYFIEQIKRAFDHFGEEKFYVFIFTDDANPSAIADKYQKALSSYKNVIFDYRRTENKHYLNVLEDMFSMANFDALVRGESGFGFIASLIGNYKLKISPTGYHKIGHKIIIDKISIESDF